MEETTKTTRRRTKAVKKIAQVPSHKHLQYAPIIATTPVNEFSYKLLNESYFGMDPGFDDGPYVAEIRERDPKLPDGYDLIIHNLSTGLYSSICEQGSVAKFAFIANRVSSILNTSKVRAFFLEDYAPSRSHKAHAMGEIGFAVRYVLSEFIENKAYSANELRAAAPANCGTIGIGQWKKMIGLKGNASKLDVVLLLSKRYGLDEVSANFKNHNIADAVGIALAAFGHINGELPPIGTKFYATFV